MVCSSLTQIILSLGAAVLALAVTISGAFPQAEHWLPPLSLLCIASAAHGTWRMMATLRAVRTMVGACGNGNLEPRLWVPSERGLMARFLDDINHMVDVVDAFVREAKAAMQSAMEEQYYRKIQLTGLPGTYRQGADIFNTGLDAIRENTLRSMRKAITELDAAAQQGDTQAKQLLSSASVTTESISRVAAAMEEMSATIAEIARQIDHATRISGETSQKAQGTNNKIHGLMDAVQQVTSIAGTIQGIAHKTNLLALNATIEAARAGDAGAGFAVVASEVKTLATNTRMATEEISANVECIQTQMGAVNDAIAEMLTLVKRVDEAALVISSAMTEQSTATQEIARAVQDASTSSRQVTHTAQEVSAQASRTWDVSKNMQTMCA